MTNAASDPPHLHLRASRPHRSQPTHLRTAHRAPRPDRAVDAGRGARAADDRISIDDFMKVELRVAKILEAERVPKSKKLVKMPIDVGTEQRTIVAGIAEAYEPEALVGKTVVIVANLQAGEADGHRVERHGARRQPRRRPADRAQRRARGAGHAGSMSGARPTPAPAWRP